MKETDTIGVIYLQMIFFSTGPIFWFGCCVSVDSLTIRYEITNCHVHDCSGCYTGTRMNNGDFLFVCSVLLIWCWCNDRICTQNIETKRHRSTVKISASTSTKVIQLMSTQDVHARQWHYIVFSEYYSQFFFIECICLLLFFCFLLRWPFNYYAFTFNNTFPMRNTAKRQDIKMH